MIISQEDFLKILTEPQKILLGDKTLENFIEFMLKEYKELDHICYRSKFELIFMEDEISFSSYLKIDIDEVNNQFTFFFENEDYETIASTPEEFQKNIAYIALDTIRIIAKWQNMIFQEQLTKQLVKVDETQSIHKELVSYFKIKNKYKNLIFEVSFSGEPIEEIDTTSDDDSSDFEWI